MSVSRYARQESVRSVGEDGQRTLSGSRVLVVGAGGLGCPALLFLAGAGVGTIGIADGDVVDVTNLHRQVLYTEQSVGRNKAREAARLLFDRNSSIAYEFCEQYISSSNFDFVVMGWDVVIDATDRTETRYLLDDVCRVLGIPLVHASVSGDEIQVAVFDSSTGNPHDRSCYRDLYPLASSGRNLPTCAIDGILGPVPGIAGTIQARECLNLLLGHTSELKGKLLWMDTVRYQHRLIDIPANRQQCGEWPHSLGDISAMDYTQDCLREPSIPSSEEDWMDALHSGALLIDVRELNEQPRIEGLHNSVSMPMSSLDLSSPKLESYHALVVLCQSGSRASAVCRKLAERWPEKRILHITGGVNSLVNQLSTLNAIPK